jgi:hypothetical protein
MEPACEMTEPLAVYLEIGAKRTFAGAVEWPGWCRSGKTPDEALEALLAYADRYAKAVARTKLAVPQPRDVDQLEVVERVKGNATTDFGAPGVPSAADDRPLSTSELKRQSALIEACWHAFEAAWKKAAKARVELSKGPRGGGRDLPKMWDHVVEADVAYLGGLGSREPGRPGATAEARMAAVHETALEAFAARARGKPIAVPRQTKRLWLPRYFVRRSAWHALDHAWEIDDRS